MPRRNEQISAIRQEPFAYIAEYDSNGRLEYEAWAQPGSSTSDSIWIACKHSYDSNGNHTGTKWAQGSEELYNTTRITIGEFNVAANSLSTLTYV